ncbi:MAG: DUF5640 domain-containing protein [Clostridiales bacterium]|nr:DUF5640 domain-containing protein [Clostridiales bacterium]
MKKSLRPVSLILCIAAVFTLFAACSSTSGSSANTKSLIGSWKNQKSELAYVFNEDDTLEYYVYSYKDAGTYSVDGDVITIVRENTGTRVEYLFKIKDDVLYLYEEDEEPEDGLLFDKVESLNMKSGSEAVEDIVDQLGGNSYDDDDNTEDKTDAETSAEDNE